MKKFKFFTNWKKKQQKAVNWEICKDDYQKRLSVLIRIGYSVPEASAKLSEEFRREGRPLPRG